MFDSDLLQRSGLVKICGLREPAHALVAAESGADLLGLNFVPSSKRRIDSNQARSIVREVHTTYGDRGPQMVGIFVDEPAERINETASAVGIDAVQLNGSESADYLERLRFPVIRSLSPPPGSTLESVVSTIEDQYASEEMPPLFLLDAYDPVQHGGTGKRADWSLARDLSMRLPVMLAGGLTPENVAMAIDAVRPLGVDVASGVETDGVKDPVKIREFIANAKHAFSALQSSPVHR
jgi:phosphoribosylanthranilate isomerase